MVAVSTKYLTTEQHGWSGDKGACGRCMCVHIRGVDNKYNPGVRKRVAKQHFGLTFLGKVGIGSCGGRGGGAPLLRLRFDWELHRPANTARRAPCRLPAVGGASRAGPRTPRPAAAPQRTPRRALGAE